jgi:hypothetical protein
VFARPLAVDKFKHLCRYFPHAHHGFDKKGQPIYIDCTGKLDVDACLGSVSVEEVLHSHVIMMVRTLLLVSYCSGLPQADIAFRFRRGAGVPKSHPHEGRIRQGGAHGAQDVQHCGHERRLHAPRVTQGHGRVQGHCGGGPG